MKSFIATTGCLDQVSLSYTELPQLTLEVLSSEVIGAFEADDDERKEYTETVTQ
jgi:hypothetical protein